MADLTQFDIGSAQRIARVVRQVEQQRPPAKPLVFTPLIDGRGATNVRLGRIADGWLKNTVKEVEIWEAGDTPNEQTSDAFVYAVNKLYPVDGPSFVVLAKASNGVWYLAACGVPDPVGGSPTADGCHFPAIAGHALGVLPNFDPNKIQALVHNNNCLMWMDIEDCPVLAE